MQLLIEEFFKKVYKFIKEINILPIRLILKLLFYIIILGVIGLIIFGIYSGKKMLVLIILGVLMVGEVAHYIRKTREQVMVYKKTQKNISKKIKESSKNKDLLEKPKKEALKNNSLLGLKKEKSLNKGLLNEK